MQRSVDMFDAEFLALGDVLKAVYMQGSLFFETYVADPNTPETKWFLYLFSAVVVYGFVDLFLKRRTRR